MRIHRKTGVWLKEVFQLFHGAAKMTIHREPPAHYLEYQVAGRLPVILIPGILGKWGYMKRLGDKISLRGHSTYIVPGLGYNIYSIPSSAKILRSLIVHIIPKLGHIIPHLEKGALKVRKLIEKEKLEGAILVTHSKGGLIGKYLLAHHNADGRVIGVVAISTPFSGSALAHLIPHHSYKELRIDSKIVADLEKHTAVNQKIISIFPEYDPHIWAKQGSYLKGAKNLKIPVGGHNTLLANKKIIRAVLKSIDEITAAFKLEKFNRD